MTRRRAPSAVRALATLALACAALATGPRSATRARADDAPADAARALAARGIENIRSMDSERERVGARELVHAGDAGLALAIRALEGGEPALRTTLALLGAVASFDTAVAEAAITRFAAHPRFEVRAVVAQGLGGGRDPASIGVLGRFAGDPTPSVRSAALRALFAIDREDAAAARAAWPRDAAADVRVRRLRLHRLRGDRSPVILRLAAHAYAGGETPDERVAGARLWVAQGPAGSPALARFIVAEFGGDPFAAVVARTLLGGRGGRIDPAEARLAAAEALIAHLARGGIGQAERDATLGEAVNWIAHAARVEGRHVDDEARTFLFAALPDLARRDASVRDALVADVSRRMRSAQFDNPAHGIWLLRGVGEAGALPALAALFEPDRVPHAVLLHVSGALRDLQRTGGEEIARRLVDRARPSDIRADGVRAIAGEPWSLASKFLPALLDDRDDAVASQAATALLARPEPEARAALEAALLDSRWRPYEQNALHALVAAADDAAYALLTRLLREGGTEPRRAVFIEVSTPASSLRGPRAIALVELAIADPSFGIDIGTLATALSSVDGKAAVRYIRANWKNVTRPGVLLRNLQVVAEPEALDFALEIAATLGDDDDRMLGEVCAVLCGRAASAPARTDPFWKRLLSRGSGDMVRVAVRALTGVDHGPMGVYLVPHLADANQFAASRRDALLALERGGEPLPERLLYRLASNRTEDEDLRLECARALVPIASDATRESAIEWLAEAIDESSAAVVRIAEVAGTGATAERARRLLGLFQRAVAARFAGPPYARRIDDDDAARSVRVQALAVAVAVTRDPAALDGLTDALLDPRFAEFQRESRGLFAHEHASGGGPLTSGVDPLELDVSLRFDGATPTETPRAPLPPEAGDIVEALVRTDRADGIRRIAARIERAKADGTLARFDDLFGAWISRRIAATRPDDARGGAVGPAAAAPPLPPPTRPDGPEAAFEWDRRSHAAEALSSFVEAAAWARASLAAGSRCGVFDLPPATWIDRGRVPRPSWNLLKARIEMLDAAALAREGRAEEARARFAAATARDPLDPRVFQAAARLRLRAGFELAAARADVRRAADLERRQGDEPSRDTRELLAALR